MHVDVEKKLVWFTDNNINEREIVRILHNKGFAINIYDRISHKIDFDEISDTFTSFVTTDNPYKKIVSLFKKTSHINWSLKKYSEEEFIKSFRLWFDKNFEFSTESQNLRYINSLEPKILEKTLVLTPQNHIFLPFLGEITFKNDVFYKNVLKLEQAKLIYHNSKHIFDFCDFDPFSFTDQDMTDKEKIDFIHRY